MSGIAVPRADVLTSITSEWSPIWDRRLGLRNPTRAARRSDPEGAGPNFHKTRRTPSRMHADHDEQLDQHDGAAGTLHADLDGWRPPRQASLGAALHEGNSE